MHVGDDDDAGPDATSPTTSDVRDIPTSSATKPTGAPGPTATVGPIPPRVHRVFWWKEAVIVVAFYVVYSWIRNQFGSNRIAAEGIPFEAFENAERIIRWQQTLGLWVEPTIQQWYLDNLPGITGWNIFYGTAHFAVTLAVFVVLFRKRPAVFPQWRNSLAAMTALALIGFVAFPVMPPRLLDDPCPWEAPGTYGGRCIASELRTGPEGGRTFGFVDTMEELGGLWSFDSQAFASISNQYAAMPSLHIGWAMWCAIAMWPLLRRRRSKIAVLVYPAATLFCIIVTGNHYWSDGVGGVAVFALGAVVGWGLHRWNQDRLDGRHARLHAA